MSEVIANKIQFEVEKQMTIQADAWGSDENPPVLLAHGGGQTRHAWGATAKELAEKGWYAIAIDQRGHGDSAWSKEGDYQIGAFARDLVAISRQLKSKPALIGASLGGLAGIMAEGDVSQNEFSSLILVDVTPEINKEGVDKILGFMGQDMEQGFASLDEAADTIAAYIPHRPRPKNLDGLSKNLRFCEDGRYRWHWDPKFMLEKKMPDGPIEFNPMVEAAKTLKLPVLLVRGKLSELVTEEAAKSFLELVPHAEYVDVKNAGHMIAGDKNDIFSAAIINFLS